MVEVHLPRGANGQHAIVFHPSGATGHPPDPVLFSPADRIVVVNAQTCVDRAYRYRFVVGGREIREHESHSAQATLHAVRTGCMTNNEIVYQSFSIVEPGQNVPGNPTAETPSSADLKRAVQMAGSSDNR